MVQTIRIGLLKATPGWCTILDQIGAPRSYGFRVDSVDTTSFSLLIINRALEESEAEAIKQYLQSGGALIDTGYFITSVVKGCLSKHYFTSILPGKLPGLPDLDIIDLFGKHNTFSTAPYLDKLLFLEPWLNGHVCFLGIDVDSAIQNSSWRYKQFAANSPHFPYEAVGNVSKGSLQILIFHLIKRLHTLRALPFCHTWFFPQKSPGIFLFRIDSDFGQQQQVLDWYKRFHRSGKPITWFLHVEAHEKWLDLFRSFNDHEIALHCYNHIYSKNTKVIREDMTKAYDLLKSNGLDPCGHAAPYGVWHKEREQACRKLNITYSSDFSLWYDSLPIFPCVNNHTGILQIPIHPICIGSLIRAGASDEQIIEYYRQLLEYTQAHLQPFVLYDHLHHGKAYLYEEIFRELDKKSIPSLCFRNYATYWHKRNTADLLVRVENKSVTIKKTPSTRVPGDPPMVCIWTDDKTYFLSEENTTVDIQTATLSRLPEFTKKPIDIGLLRSTNLRFLRHIMLDSFLWRKRR